MDYLEVHGPRAAESEGGPVHLLVQPLAHAGLGRVGLTPPVGDPAELPHPVADDLVRRVRLPTGDALPHDNAADHPAEFASVTRSVLRDDEHLLLL